MATGSPDLVGTVLAVFVEKFGDQQLFAAVQRDVEIVGGAPVEGAVDAAAQMTVRAGLAPGRSPALSCLRQRCGNPRAGAAHGPGHLSGKS